MDAGNANAHCSVPEFFISRAGPDKDIALRIADILEAAGRRVLIQDRDFANRSFMERMQHALVSNARTIALLSPEYLRRDHCAAEWMGTIADDPLNKQSKLIVLRIRPCDPPGLLKSLAYWDLVPLLPEEEAGSLRDVVLSSVLVGRWDGPPSGVLRYFEASKPILHNEIKPVPNFTAREDALAAISAALSRGSATAITQPAAVHGLGGIGKTTLARQFAWEAAEKETYAGIWWLRAEKLKDATSWDGIEQGLADLRNALFPGLEPIRERAEAARAALRFLSRGGFDKPWLLVYDNVDDEELLEAWLPPASVQVLITSRLGGWGAEVVAVEVEEWAEDEAIRYLHDASGRGDLDEAALRQITNALGRLPLALSHAAAYLKRNRAITVTTYLADLARQMTQVPRGASYKTSVFATFRLAIRQAEAEAPDARDVLTLAAFFAPNDIPEELFQHFVESEVSLAEAISALDHLSLVDFDAKNRTFSVHSLVQAAVRSELPSEEIKTWVAAGVDVCAIAQPGVGIENWDAAQRLLPHAQAVTNIASDEIGPPLAYLLNLSGTYLYERGAYMEAEPLLVRALSIWQEVSNPDCLKIADALNNLARLYNAQGKYDAAEPLYERGLATREKVVGPDDPGVAIALNNLGDVYRGRGKYDAAKPLYDRALTILEKAVGSDDTRVAAILNNLAELYRAEGKYDIARPLYERALAIRENALGPDHPEVARALNDLALLHHDYGNLEGAGPLLERALAIWEKTLGSQHPTVAHALNNLARCHHARQHFDTAKSLFERALATFEKVLGPDHPNVALTLNNLGALYRDQGKHNAQPLYRRALSILENALGPNHPDVAYALSNLANLHNARGEYNLARPLHERALAIVEGSFGPAHPDVTPPLMGLAVTYFRQGRYEKARTFLKRALFICEKTLDPDHERTRIARRHLATIDRKITAPMSGPWPISPKIPRNNVCPCGSGKKYKHCCGR
jgi:tetratricopeptide (TPR) repeat protein